MLQQTVFFSGSIELRQVAITVGEITKHFCNFFLLLLNFSLYGPFHSAHRQRSIQIPRFASPLDSDCFQPPLNVRNSEKKWLVSYLRNFSGQISPDIVRNPQVYQRESFLSRILSESGQKIVESLGSKNLSKTLLDVNNSLQLFD
jgi:hypothetical protein